MMKCDSNEQGRLNGQKAGDYTIHSIQVVFHTTQDDDQFFTGKNQAFSIAWGQVIPHKLAV